VAWLPRRRLWLSARAIGRSGSPLQVQPSTTHGQKEVSRPIKRRKKNPKSTEHTHDKGKKTPQRVPLLTRICRRRKCTDSRSFRLITVGFHDEFYGINYHKTSTFFMMGTDLMREENEPVSSPRHSANSFPRRCKWRETTTVTATVSRGILCHTRSTSI
jgi:hypothetical protein